MMHYKLKINPFVKIFRRVNNKIEKAMLWNGFMTLKN